MAGEEICVSKLPASSAGIWLDDSPFNASTPLLMAQLMVIVGTSQALHGVLRHLGQPLFVSQIIAGIILGPSCLGQLHFFKNVLYSETGWLHLNTMMLIGLVFFRFIVGLKTDVGMIMSIRKKALIIALAGRIASALVLSTARIIWQRSIPYKIRKSDILSGMSGTWSLSSFIVISSLLNELHMLNSKVGRIAIAASLVDSLVDMLFRFLSSVVRSSVGGTGLGWVGVIASHALLVAFIITVARWVASWVVKRTPEGEQLDEGDFLAILVLALSCGLLSEMIGYHIGMGILLVGLALPSGPPLGYTMVERLEGIVMTLSMPVFMAKPGFLSNFLLVAEDMSTWSCLLFLIFLSVLGKIMGVMLSSICFKMPLQEALPLSLIMASKGFYEVEFLLQWKEARLIDIETLSVFTISIVIVAATTTPLIKALNRPFTQILDCSWRTIQHSLPDDPELRILVCIHNGDNVAPILNLLRSIYPNAFRPLCLQVLHLVQLAGRAATVFVPYCKHKKSSTMSETDRIVNAFRIFAQQQAKGCISLQPFISVSPIATMHEDICTLAHDKKASLVILPLQRDSISVRIQSFSQAASSVNFKVISYAPCSVAILATQGMGNQSFDNVVLYFLGGADDREALALAIRMAENPNIRVTVFRFLSSEELSSDGMEEKIDNEMLDASRHHRRMVYHEEVVQDSEQLIDTIQMTSVNYGLVIVGRGERIESPLTSGLLLWDENPELGGIGDMLASIDFGGRVSILVVQQQRKISSVFPDSTNEGRDDTWFGFHRDA